MKLHLGCGWRDFGTDWVHVDGGTYQHLDYYNITDLEWCESSTVDLIYCSHTLEYFDRDEVLDVLKEWNRVLKPNGVLRLAVPNFGVMSELYKNGSIKLEQMLGPLYGKMDMGDVKIYHKTTYDFNSLKNVLESSGFINVDYYDWRGTDHSHIDDHSQAYMCPDRDKENGTLISLNVECNKI